MAITLAQLRARIRRRSNDPEGRLWSDDLIDDGIREALLALGDYSGVVTSYTYTSEEDEADSFELPADFLRLVKVPPLRSSSGGTDEYTFSEYLNAYQPEPGDEGDSGYWIAGGAIHVTDGVDAGETFTIVYEALWPSVAEEDDELDLPHWAERALGFYAIYYCLQLDGVKAAREGFSKTHYESGRPTDNPGLQSASWFFEQFDAICTRNMRHGDGR